MSVVHPRNRLVNFRLSEVEFEQLRHASIRAGARSLSEFARNSVLRSLEESPLAGGPAWSRLTVLDRRVAELEVALERLVRLWSAARIGAAGREASCAWEGGSGSPAPGCAREPEPGR